ncbi:hypothetical protein FQN60_014358 [Etheostoma spectabile]|uniref:Uncharacterized protein n=1 Tax=Etheostoma spectabile TaxID=54343 RepID=A0A5J5DAB4_9PERO|nr:hypothetical protein FQN60_014358 [Etheostoma spectabile]
MHQALMLDWNCNVDGFTPLHVAALHGHPALAALFVRHGANVNARNNQSATPLHLACQNSHSNALVNVANLQGNTALHEAVRGGHQALVELLLRGGASPGLRNKRQRTPLDCAYELGGKNTEILRALQTASGLSPDAEPIKLLSDLISLVVAAHSFVQRLRLQDHANGRRQKLAQSISRRGETVEVSCPSASLGALPRLRERPLGRCHTLDSGEQTPEPTHTPHTPDPTENTPLERDQTADAHTDRDPAQPEAKETHSTGGESSPPSPSPSDDPFEPRPTHTPPAPCAPHGVAEPSDPTDKSLRSVNGGLESSDAHANDEVLRSEDTDGDSGLPCPTIQSDGGDQRDGDRTPERGGESNHEGCN